MGGLAITCCDICGDFLFNGAHRGHVEIWCRAIRETNNPGAAEIVSASSASETITAQAAEAETISVRRGRPRKGTASETITAARPWAAAGLSRATWYRRMKG
jgi:hypothetical protein